LYEDKNRAVVKARLSRGYLGRDNQRSIDKERAQYSLMTAADTCAVEKAVTNTALSHSASVKIRNRSAVKFRGSQPGSFAADTRCSVNMVIPAFTQTNL